MKTELKQAWANALTGGKYKQTRLGYLKTKRGYCCLGVLCDVAGEKNWQNGNFLSGAALKRVGLTQEIQNKLVNMNDNGHWSFKRIAAWITENL